MGDWEIYLDYSSANTIFLHNDIVFAGLDTAEDGITVIEWAEIIGDILDDDVIQVKFARIQNNSEARRIVIRGIQFDV